jgi:hypothetical protein
MGEDLRPSAQIRATAPVARSVFWLMISLLAWEIYQGVRVGAAVPSGSWSHTPFDLVFLVLLPALVAFAFTRLFLVLTQSNRGTLSIYSVISSPWAWIFWVGLSIGLVGYGVHTAAHSLYRAMPDVLAQGEFAAKIHFLDADLGYLLLGIGFFLATVAVILVGQGAAQRLSGGERLLFGLGSLATYGVALVYMGVGGQQIIAAIVASVAIVAISLWILPPSEVTHDPIGALITPGAFAAAITLIVWTIVVGGQPTWP